MDWEGEKIQELGLEQGVKRRQARATQNKEEKGDKPELPQTRRAFMYFNYDLSITSSPVFI